MEQGNIDPKEKAAALFANLVMQQANAALMFMGKAPNPETGEPVKDLQAAQYFIDQIEMLETKTKGNLSPEEEALLKQTLMTVRMGYVESVNESKGQPSPASAPPPAAAPAGSPSPEAGKPAGEAPPSSEEEGKKKFVKKY